MRDLVRHAVLPVCVLGLLGMPGCRVMKKWFNPADDAELVDTGVGSGNALTTVQDAQLSDPETRQGLEVRLLVVDDTLYDAPRALFGLPVPEASAVDPQTRDTWARWGFRMVEVPVEELGSVLGSMRPVRPVSNQWLGEFSNWRGLIRAGELGQRRVRVGSTTAAIEAGRPRLIARAWTSPQLVDDGVVNTLRVDLGVQIEAGKQSSFTLLPDDQAKTLDDDGQVIESLFASFTMSGDHALIIVGEQPGADWADLPEPSSIDLEPDFPDQMGPTPGEESPDSDNEDSEVEEEVVPFSRSNPGGIRSSRLRRRRVHSVSSCLWRRVHV